MITKKFINAPILQFSIRLTHNLAKRPAKMAVSAPWVSASAKTAFLESFAKMKVSALMNKLALALLGDTSFMWWIIVFALIVAMIALVYLLIIKTKEMQRVRASN